MLKEITTIKHIADYTGVSFKTVSRVINGSNGVRLEKRLKVEEAIKKFQYRPNIGARSIRTRLSQVVGFISDYITSTPFAVDVVHGAEVMAWEHDRMLLVVNTQSNRTVLEQAIEMMLSRQVEGIIYAAMYHREVEMPNSIKQVPAILVNCFSRDRSIKSVVPDEFEAGKCATEILIKKGHTRIALINLPDDSAAAQGRLAGYIYALEKYGITYNPNYVIPGIVRNTNGEKNIAHESAIHLLVQNNPPTAIFCGNDRIAMCVFDAVKENGCSIPDDVAIIGFDNQEVIATNLRPSLSTMALPHKKMGSWAIDQLLNCNDSDSLVQKKMECKYIMRKSV